MKKKALLKMCMAAFIVFAVSCSNGSTNAKNNSEVQNVSTEVFYTCTMHPQVHSKTPGKCPICGMELVKKEVAESDSVQMHQPSDSVHMN